MIHDYGDQSTARQYFILLLSLATNAASIAPECFQRHLMFYTCNYNIRVTLHRNGAIKHIFYTESDPRRDHRQIVLYSFCRSMRLLFLWRLKYYFKSFCASEDLSTLALHTSVGCISLQNASRTALCYATNTIKVKTFLIFDINHQQNTRRSDQIETIKTIIQTTRPRITWKVYQWLGLPF